MADVNANIGVKIDTSEALSELKNLQRQISQFHSSIAKSSSAAATAQKNLQNNLINSINSIGAFSAEMRTIRTTSESFTNSLEKNKFSMGEYFRYATASTKRFGKVFQSEYDTIGKVAEDRVKKLQTQYIKMGRDATGAMKAIAVIPNELNLKDHTTQVQLAAQKQQLFNQLLKQGSTNLLNFGKNTQWAGRQLMVGFTLPLATFGTTASRIFMDLETSTLKFKKVYGDLLTSPAETQQQLDQIKQLASTFTQYGIAVKDTMSLAADAAAAGFEGAKLQAQTTQATRLSVLGQIDQQKALETTISLQNAFKMSSADLAQSIDFLNAVENQTVLSLDDITTAIPKVAPVIMQLGGNVKDLAFFMTAMKEGGVNASEGANALKSGLASLINPTKKAKEMLAGYGINVENIVTKNKGNLKATVIEFAQALNQLDPLARAKSIEQMFGKFQFARLSTLFSNITKDGTQASRVLDLTQASAQSLSSTAEKELGITANSAMNKFKKSIEDLKVSIAPIGEMFLEIATPFADFIKTVVDKFNSFPESTKKAIATVTVAIAGIGPILLMTVGLLANGFANIVKGVQAAANMFRRLRGESTNVGMGLQYITDEQLQNEASAASLNQAHAKLTQRFNVEASALNKLKIAYEQALIAAGNFAKINPGMVLPSRGVKKYSRGVQIVPGSGNGDTVPAMLTPGEAVIPKAMTKKYAPLVNGMISGSIPGYSDGLTSPGGRAVNPKTFVAAHFSDRIPLSEEQISGLLNSQDLSQSVKVAIRAAQSVNKQIFGYTDSVIALSASMNQALKNNSADVTVLKNELSQNLEATHVELVRRLQESGVPKAEISASAKRISQQILASLPVSGTISEAEFNAIARNAYSTEAAASPAINNAYEEMKQISTISDPASRRKGGRTNLSAKLNTMIQGLTFRGKGYRGRRSQYADIIADTGGTYEKQFFAVGSDAAQKVAKGAQTRSPSKISKKTGQDIGDGLVVGLEEKIDDVKIAGKNLGEIAAKSTQSGVAGRSANRAQGPVAYSGGEPVVPTGANLLPIANKPTKRDLLKTKISRKFESLKTGKLGFGSAMMAGMAIPMVSSMLPNKIGGKDISGAKDFATNAASFGSMGAMLGPWGAAAGVAVAGILSINKQMSILKKNEEDHRAAAVASFKESTSVASIFGNTIASVDTKIKILPGGIKKATSEIQKATQEAEKFKKAIDQLNEEDPLKQFVTSLKENSGSALRGRVREFIAAQVSSGAVKPGKEAKQLVLDILTASGHAEQFGNIWRQVSKSVSSETVAMTTKYKKLGDEYNKVVSGNQDVLKFQSALAKAQSDQSKLEEMHKKGQIDDQTYTQKMQEVGSRIGQINNQINTLQDSSGKVNTAMTAVGSSILNFINRVQSGSIKTKAFNAEIVAMKKMGLSTKQQMDALGIAIKATGDKDSINAFSKAQEALGKLKDGTLSATNEMKSLIVMMGMANSMDTVYSAYAKRFTNTHDAAGKIAVNPTLAAKAAAAYYDTYMKAINGAIDSSGQNTGGNGLGSGSGTSSGEVALSKIQRLTIARMQQELVGLKKKRDALKDINDELKRQQDFQMKQMELTKQQTEAKISGNYMQAAIIGQQKAFEASDFKNETKQLELDKRISNLEQRITDLQAGARVTRAEEAITKAKAKKAMGGLIKGPGTGISDSITATLGYAGGGSIRVSNGEYVVKAASVKQYGVSTMNAINNGTAPIGGTTVYNDITMTISNPDPSATADLVIKKLQVISNKTNTSNAISNNRRSW